MSSTAQVSTLSILFMCFTLLVCFGGPVALIIWAKVKYKKAFSFVPLVLGAVAFVLFQIVIRISILLPYLQSAAWFQGIVTQPWLYAAFLCLTAGLFEEPARFLVYSVMRKPRQYVNGLSYGIGHGGIEAMLIVGITFINNLVFSLAINSGSWGAITAMVPPEYMGQYEAVRQALVSASPDTWLIGGVERMSTLAIQIAFSLIVMRGFITGRKWLYLGIATLVHALVNFVAVGMQILKVNMWLIEAAVFVMAVLAVWYIVRQARDWRRSLAANEGALNGPEGQANTP